MMYHFGLNSRKTWSDFFDVSGITCVLAAYSRGPNLLEPARVNIIDVDVGELDIKHISSEEHEEGQDDRRWG